MSPFVNLEGGGASGGGGGGAAQLVPTAVKTANYNLAANDLAVFNANANYNANLPAAPADKTVCAVIMIAQTGISQVTINCGGADVINVAGGATTLAVVTLFEQVTLQYAAGPAIWYVTSVGSATLNAYLPTYQTITNKRITKRTGSTAGPGATPTMATDTFDVFHFTALAAAITSMTTNLTGTPVDGDTLRVSFTDNGTARAITWGASFEASTVALPTTTVVNTRLDVGFAWNTETNKWRCVAVA
jgi:hypothetical protein